MTPERKAEIDEQIAWWRQHEHWRLSGFDIENNDPLFPPRRNIVSVSDKSEKVLHCLVYNLVFFEYGVDFEFTKRIKYEKHNGDFHAMYLEITWDDEERRLSTFWKKTPIVVTRWINSDNFEYKYPHDKIIETTVEECV